MEDDNYSNFKNYSEFGFVSRKGRGKKKNKSGTNRQPVFNSEDNKSESETCNTAESNLPEESVTEDVEDDSKNDSVTYRANVDRSLDHNLRVSLDSTLKSYPAVQTEENVEINVENKIESPLESNADKLQVEDELVETFEPNLLINRRALTKEATTYEVEKFEKNAMIIFNQENIDGFEPRLGTEEDVVSLTRSFGNIGFEVEPHKDLTKDELFKELKDFSERDFTDYGCVAVVVLTHGSNEGLLRAKDQQYNEIKIINHFKDCNKPTLVTKPKVIIIQACRGAKIVPGQPVFQAGKIRKDLDENLEPYILPVESDLLILHSSYVGSPSHRDTLRGTWFIQTLCNKIDELASTQDLESIVTEVKREVAINKQHKELNRRTFEEDINKQMPVKTSTLIRKLYLRKFGNLPIGETYADKVKPQDDSRREVLDTSLVNVAPMTPLLVQFGPCSCFLEHFCYMRNCLRYFLEENPNDDVAQSFLELANTFEDGDEFNSSKEKMSKVISKHLLSHAKSSQYYKYLYFYKHTQQPGFFK